MKFNELQFKRHSVGMGATQAVVNFPNGYGASIITGPLFYTGPDTPYELAVLHDGSLCYDTPLTSDVLGYLTEAEVQEYLDKIEAL